jgi:hypothetical protein
VTNSTGGSQYIQEQIEEVLYVYRFIRYSTGTMAVRVYGNARRKRGHPCLVDIGDRSPDYPFGSSAFPATRRVTQQCRASSQVA